MLKWILGFCLILSTPLYCSGNKTKSGMSQDALKASMCDDLDIIKNAFEVRYAPAEWKKSYVKWDLEEQINIAKAKIHSKTNIKVSNYQQILKEFINGTQDHHVGIIFYSTAAAFLPFSIQGAEGRYFISSIEDSVTGKLFVGDEIITFNGKPIQQVIDELRKQEFGDRDILTDQCLTEMMFSVRIGQVGHVIPEGPVTISVIQKGQTKPTVLNLKWLNLPEKISDGPFHNSSQSFYQSLASIIKALLENKKPNPLDYAHLNKPMQWHGYSAYCEAYERKKEYEANAEDEAVPFWDTPLMGNKNGILPNLGKPTWEAPDYYVFRAYTFKTASNKVIGYIRIPSYQFDENAPKQFSLLVNLFNKTTDALVIDQLHNPGGSSLYTYALASMLSPKPLEVPSHRISITQEDVADALKMVADLKELEGKDIPEGAMDLHGFPISASYVSGLLGHSRFVISEWNAGRFLTQPTYLNGIKTIKPHFQGAYSKPIVVLVNSLDFSGGDFFPAILQDNKRATIFGSRTAGAGGFVLTFSPPNRFGVAMYALTGSIAERLDHNPIENLGVTPDVNYEVTADDLQNGYRGYIKAVNDAVETLIKNKK